MEYISKDGLRVSESDMEQYRKIMLDCISKGMKFNSKEPLLDDRILDLLDEEAFVYCNRRKISPIERNPMRMAEWIPAILTDEEVKLRNQSKN